MTPTEGNLSTTEGLVYRAGALAAVAAAIGALFVDNEVETTLLMVSAVIAGLLCFDVSMERRLHSRWPWLLVSLAPVSKTAPLVWYELKADNGLLVERYDHAGSLVFGLCLMAAVVVLSRPSRVLGSDVSLFDSVLLFGSGLTAAAAGASVGFLFDRDFGSVTAARLLETPTWFVVGVTLVAVVLAAAHVPAPSLSLAGLLVVVAASAGLLAFTVAGKDIDRGWWALVFAGVALSAAALGPATLGTRSSRSRRSIAGVVAAVVVGLIAAAAAITARSDPSSWGPGWALLGILALAMFALAMASKPLDQQFPQAVLDERSAAQREFDLDAVEADARAKEQALRSLRGSRSAHEVPAPGFEQEIAATQHSHDPVPVQDVAQSLPSARPEVTEAPQPLASSAPPITSIQRTAPAQPVQVAPEPVQPAAPVEHPQPAPQAQAQPPAQQPQAEQTLSGAGIVASARAAASLRDSPTEHRHAAAPLQQAHHFDPSTGLLSAAGLQHALAVAFSTPRQAGHVTLMMFTIRDLDEIEAYYGRLASAAVTREIAERVRALLPGGAAARFGRSAYAIVLVGDLGPSDKTVQSLARVLLHLRAPLSEGVIGAKIDVVAGMAQCYEGEDVAGFIGRANAGLARAVNTVEATFVAMP